MNTEKRNLKTKINGKRLALGLIASLILSTFAMAQSTNQGLDLSVDKDAPSTDVEGENGFLKNWFFGINGGATFIISSLHEKPYSWAVGASLGKQLNRKVGIRADFLYGKMYSEGVLYDTLALSNSIDFMDASLIGKLSLNDFLFTKSPSRIREIYIVGGVGATFFNSRVDNTETDAFVMGQGWDATGTNKTSQVMGVFVPLGTGISVNVDKTGRLFANAEFMYRYGQDNMLDGGITSKASNYTYTSVGLTYTLGKPTVNPQLITADLIEQNVKTVVTKNVTDDITAKIDAEVQPIKDELARQGLTLAANNEIVVALQDEMESRINALHESLKEGSVTTELPDGTLQTTSLSELAAGSIPSLASIYFAFNSLYITPDMEREIAVIAKIMKKNKGLKCEITGNASNIGGPEYNLALSQKRAEAVAELMVKEFGIEQDRLTVKSLGVTDPLAKNISKINRRVDLQLLR